MYYIKNKEEYYNHITRYCKTEKEKAEVITKAYEIALETRKFEIELYWKRATYFWAFIGAIFVAYFALLNADMDDKYDLLIIPVSLLGLAFSLGWYFVNKGSKLWQENWERNIYFLEDYISGPIFKSLIIPNFEKRYFTKSYPYSVSKVNISLSLITVLFWVIIFYISSILYLEQINTVHFWCILIIGTIVLLLGIYWFHKKSLSFIFDDLNVNEQKKTGFTESKLYFNGEEPHITPTEKDDGNDDKTSQKSFFFGLIKF